MKTVVAQWRGSFLTGLTVILPAVVTLAIVVWLYGRIIALTDTLLLILPKTWTREYNGEGPVYFLWSLMALTLAILAIAVLGRFAQHYFGRILIGMADCVLMRVPLLRNIYRAVKQINEAFTSSKTAAFKQVVLVEFPRTGLYSIGFLTGTQNGEVRAKIQEPMVSVFIPAAPLTSGSVVLLAEADVIKLNMSVADGIKFIMSLGSVVPSYESRETALGAVAARDSKVCDPLGMARHGMKTLLISPGRTPDVKTPGG